MDGLPTCSLAPFLFFLQDNDAVGKKRNPGATRATEYLHSKARRVAGNTDVGGAGLLHEGEDALCAPTSLHAASLSSNPHDMPEMQIGEVVQGVVHDVNMFERRMASIGRTHQGPDSTPGEGECALLATLQTTSPTMAEDMGQNASSYVHMIAHLRRQVKDVVLDMTIDDVTKADVVEETVRATKREQVSMTVGEHAWSSDPDWKEVAEKLGKPVAGRPYCLWHDGMVFRTFRSFRMKLAGMCFI